MKVIDIIRKGTPESDTYSDSIVILDRGVELYSGQCSTHCNPFRAIDHKSWTEVYVDIAEGIYTCECLLHYRFGKCLLVNDGGEVPTINPNKLHGGLYFAKGIFVHKGYSDKWRGSKGCITISPKDYDDFMSNFELQEKIKLTLRRSI